MHLLVGLGNPGSKYARNRHNIGFMALDLIAGDHGFAPFRTKFQGRIAEGTIAGEKAVLLKPETFMNESGRSVGEAMRFYKLSAADITVFHDEIDLAPGKLRVKQGGGHAGHNGLRSLHAHIGPDYHRVRMGVGHPGHKDAVPGYVLRDFPKADEGWLDDLLRGVGDGMGALLKGDTPGFTNAVALRVNPPRPSGGTAPRKPAPTPGTADDKATAPAKAGDKTTALAPRSPLQRLADRFR